MWNVFCQWKKMLIAKNGFFVLYNEKRVFKLNWNKDYLINHAETFKVFIF